MVMTLGDTIKYDETKKSISNSFKTPISHEIYVQVEKKRKEKKIRKVEERRKEKTARLN